MKTEYSYLWRLRVFTCVLWTGIHIWVHVWWCWYVVVCRCIRQCSCSARWSSVACLVSFFFILLAQFKRLWCLLNITNYYYFCLMAIFPGKFGSASFPLVLSSPVSEENLWGLVEHGFLNGPDVLLATQPSVSKQWREHKALTLTSGLASSFLHPSLNSWWKGHCCLYATLRRQYHVFDIIKFLFFCG